MYAPQKIPLSTLSPVYLRAMTEKKRNPEEMESPVRGDQPSCHWRRRKEGWDFGFRKGGDLNHKGALFLSGLLVSTWLLALLYLSLVSYTMIQARYVQNLREELIQLQIENAVLEQQMGEALRGLLQQVAGMGFVPAPVEFLGP